MPNAAEFPARLCYDLSVVIASGQTSSGAVDLQGTTLVGIQLPATFTGTALTFTAATAIGGTYQAVYSSGSAYSVTVAQGKFIALDPSVFAGIRFIKIVSGSSEGGARTLELATRPV